MAYGVDLGDPAEQDERSALLRKAIADHEILPFGVEEAKMYGVMASLVRAAGRSWRPRRLDLQIAATAAAARLPLLTTNPKDFSGTERLVDIVALTRITRWRTLAGDDVGGPTGVALGKSTAQYAHLSSSPPGHRDRVAAALKTAKKRWPEASPSQLLQRLIAEGHAALTDPAAEDLAVIARTAGGARACTGRTTSPSFERLARVIILDASVVIAHLDNDDALHERAVEVLSEHAGQPRGMNVTVRHLCIRASLHKKRQDGYAEGTKKVLMLFGLRVANVLSFRDEQHISLVATELNDGSARPTGIRDRGKEVSVVPVLGIYGANASGKTNALAALSLMRAAVGP